MSSKKRYRSFHIVSCKLKGNKSNDALKSVFINMTIRRASDRGEWVDVDTFVVT